jgi:hypothetical protein
LPSPTPTPLPSEAGGAALGVVAEFLLPGCAPALVAGAAAPPAGVAFSRALRAMLAAFTGVRTAGVALAATRCVGGGGGGGAPVAGAPPPAAVAPADAANSDPTPGALGAGWAPAGGARRAPEGGGGAPAAFTALSLVWTRLPASFSAATYGSLCPLSLAAPPACVADRLNALAPGSAFWSSALSGNASAPLRAQAAAVMGAWLSLLLGGGAPPALTCGGDAPLCGLLLGGGGAAKLPAAGAAAAVAAAVGVGAAGAGGATPPGAAALSREELISLCVGATAGGVLLLGCAGAAWRRAAEAAHGKRVALLAGPGGLLPPSLSSRGARKADGRILVGRGSSPALLSSVPAADEGAPGGSLDDGFDARVSFSHRAPRARALSGASAQQSAAYRDGGDEGGGAASGGSRTRAPSLQLTVAQVSTALAGTGGGGGRPRARSGSGGADAATAAALMASLSPFAAGGSAAAARRSVRGASLLASLERSAERPAPGAGWGGAVSARDVARAAAAATGDGGGVGERARDSISSSLGRGRALSAAERAAAVPAAAFWKVHSSPDGRAYFANSKTGEVQWAPPPARPSNLLPGWEVRTSSATGAAYFRNEEKGVSAWEAPVVKRGNDGVQDGSAEAAAAEGGAGTALPEGWTAAFSKRHGRPYYVSKHTKETRWELPTA